MVVDDNAGILQVVSAILSVITDARIDCFESGEDALRHFDANPEAVGVVITDMEMPGMNGLELCHALRERRADLKVLLMTGNQTAIDPASARLCGFDGMMYKPFLPGDLRNLLENAGALARHSSAREAMFSSRPA